MSAQLPQASASTNSAIRAVASFPDEESHEVGTQSSDSDIGVTFLAPENVVPVSADGTGNQTPKSPNSIPTPRDLVRQRARVSAQRAIAAQAVPGDPPRLSIPPFLSFQSLEVDMSHFRPGVYMLVRDNAVVYVGSSVDVIARIASHRKGWERKDFHRALFLPCPASERLEIEGALIRFFLPEYNGIAQAPPFNDNDACIRRWLKLPAMHPEVRKLYRQKMKLRKMERARLKFNHPAALPHRDDP